MRATINLLKRFQLVFYLSLGVICGLYFPTYAGWAKPFAQVFISLLKLISVPLVFISCLLAILSLERASILKRIAPKILLYYFSTSLLASIVGVACSFTLTGSEYTLSDEGTTGQVASFAGLITRIFPHNMFAPFVEGNILQVLTLAVLLGISFLTLSSDHQRALRRPIDALNAWVNTLVGWVISLTPMASFFLAFELCATLDMSDLERFGGFVFALAVASGIHAGLTLPLILWGLTRTSPLTFFKQVHQALLVALTTASSSGTLPVSKAVLEEEAGVSEQSTSLVLPLGATINMDGSAVYQAQLLLLMCVMSGQSLSVMFVSQTILLVLLSSAGTAGIPGGGVAMMTLMISTLGLPLEYLGLYILLDRVLDYPITAMNVWGDLVGAKVIDHRVLRNLKGSEVSVPGEERVESMSENEG